MATTVTHTLKSSGGDYSSINTWRAAVGRDLVADDEIARLEVYKAGWGPSTPLSESFIDLGTSFVTDATRRVEIVVLAGERHDFTEGSGFVFTVPTSFGWVNRNDHVLLEGFEMDGCTQTSDLFFQPSNTILQDCLIHDIGAAGKPVFLSGTINYCMFYRYTGSSANNTLVAQNATIDHCTVFMRTGEFGWSGDMAFNNCTTDDTIVFREQAEISIDAYYACSGDYNGINQTGAGVPGANSVTTLATSDFEDYANDDYRIKSTSAFATNGSGGGQMGAAVTPGGGGGLSIPVAMQHYRSQGMA